MPSSRSTSFIAAKIGRSGQPVQNDGGRPCTSLATSAAALLSRCFSGAVSGEGASAGNRSGRTFSMNFLMPSRTTPPVYSPAIGSTSLPCTRVWMSARRRMVLTACSM